MKKSHNETTPKLVGGFVFTGAVLIAVYTLVLSPNTKADRTTASNASAQVTPSTKVGSASLSTTNPSGLPSSSTSTNKPNSDTAMTTYADGTYTATKNYNVPHGAVNSITVQIAVKDDAVLSVNVDNSYNDRESATYISRFESNVSAAVKGKKLSSLSVGRIGGASLTSSAFKQALSTIVAEAKV